MKPKQKSINDLPSEVCARTTLPLWMAALIKESAQKSNRTISAEIRCMLEHLLTQSGHGPEDPDGPNPDDERQPAICFHVDTCPDLDEEEDNRKCNPKKR